MDSLININGISDVANNVIEKISSATSWVFSRETPQKIAVNTYIEEIKKGPYDSLTKAALISNAKRSIKEYCNQCDIVQKAISLLTGEPHTSDVSDDWIAEFMDKARLVSDEEFQILWAKILSGEMEHPGSYSLRTLETIKGLSKKEAELFQKIACFVVRNNNRFFVYSNEGLLKKYDVYYVDFLSLDDCGLFSGQSLSLNLTVDKNKTEGVICNKRNIGILHYSEGKKNTVSIGIHVLSEAGRELINAIDIEPNSEFFVEMMKSINAHNKDIVMTAHNITEYSDSGIIRYERKNILDQKDD